MGMNGKRILCALLIGALVLLSAGAAGNKEATKADGTVTLRIYTQYSEGDAVIALDYARAEMKKIMPEVNLVIEVEAQDDNEKLKALAASNNLPDIFKTTSDMVELLGQSGKLLKLDPYVAKFGIDKQLSPTGLALTKNANGEILSMVNVGSWAATMFYNKKIFADNSIKIPTNFDEMLAAVKALRAKGITPLAIHAQEKWPAVQLYDFIVTREEPLGVMKLDSGKASPKDPAFRKAAEKMAKLVEAGIVSKDAGNTSYDRANELFMAGKAAMMINGAWGMAMYGANPDLDLLYYPFADAGKEAQAEWVMSGGGFNQGFSVSATSPNKDIAARYAVQLAMKFAEGRVLKVADPNPIMLNPPAPEAGYNVMQQRYVRDSARFKSMTVFPWGIKNQARKTVIEDNTHQLLLGDITVATFLDNMEKGLK
jgi:raffinose/stachyose/melibiose transport system substrate-binding protein